VAQSEDSGRTRPMGPRVSPARALSTPTRRRRPWPLRGTPRRVAVGYLFMLPSLVVIGVFVLWPIAQIVWYSLHQWSFIATDHPFVGADNYRQMADDSRFWGDLRNTALFIVGVVPASVLLPLPVAVALHLKLRGRALFRAAVLSPGRQFLRHRRDRLVAAAAARHRAALLLQSPRAPARRRLVAQHDMGAPRRDTRGDLEDLRL